MNSIAFHDEGPHNFLQALRVCEHGRRRDIEGGAELNALVGGFRR